MKRRLITILLSGVITLLVAIPLIAAEKVPVISFSGMETTLLPASYSEAPALRTKVATGELPPVKERLPEEPMVVKPVEEIGRYGGTLYQASLGATGFYDFEWAAVEVYMGQFNNEVSKVLPSIAKGYELSEDKKTLTLFLRKGMRWSDGVPFTVDDIMFWWEDEALNKDLYPIPPSAWTLAGKLAEFEKIDDYTLQIHFPMANPTVITRLCDWTTAQSSFFDPKHYLKKWHIKYNPDANELAKEEGYEHWWEAFTFHETYGTWARKDVNLPTLAPYNLSKFSAATRLYERNPYYWAIDTEGNQLPYIDKVMVFNISSKETVELKTIAGELSFSGFMLGLGNYPLYKENAAKGEYRVLLYTSPYSSLMHFGFNLNHKDPVLRDIFQDIRFRRAMSLAINRDEINEAVYYGLGTPTQSTVCSSVSYFKKEWAENYAQYDPERANQLLDEMGLEWDPTHTHRLRPDGKPLAVTVEYADEESPFKVCELVQRYWTAVGLNAYFKTTGRSLYYERVIANEHDVGLWHSAYGGELRAYTPYPYNLNPEAEAVWALEWGKWRRTKGEEGEEPPKEWKEEFEKLDKWCYSALTDEEYKQLAQEIWDFYSDQLVLIGTVGYTPCPIVVKNNLRNVPEKAYWGADELFTGTLLGVQWFFAEK